MRILVTTSDQFLHLLSPYAILFEKYWPGQQVTFLGFDNSSLPSLPDNFEFVSLGSQKDFGKAWTTPLIPYIDSVKEDYFAVVMGDMVLTDYVDIERMNLLKEIVKSGSAQKAILDTHLNGYSLPYDENLVQLTPTAPYRTTLHPAIWRKEYFQKYLKPAYTAWDFEIKNMPESQQDGATIVSLRSSDGNTTVDPSSNVFKTSNVYKKGVPFPRRDLQLPWGSSAGIRKEDILLVYNYILEGSEKKKTLLAKFDELLEDGKLYC
jgi:hypothetical protein